MSLCHVFVQAQDGRWYTSPTIAKDDWFLCWDDDEPIELVVMVTAKHLAAVRFRLILTELAGRGFWLEPDGRSRYTDRCFPQLGEKARAQPAASIFLNQVAGAPPAEMFIASPTPKKFTSALGLLPTNRESGVYCRALPPFEPPF